MGGSGHAAPAPSRVLGGPDPAITSSEPPGGATDRGSRPERRASRTAARPDVDRGHPVPGEPSGGAPADHVRSLRRWKAQGPHRGTAGRYGKRRKGRVGAGDGIRTRDIQLGRLALHQLSYSRPITPPSADDTSVPDGSSRRRYRTWLLRQGSPPCPLDRPGESRRSSSVHHRDGRSPWRTPGNGRHSRCRADREACPGVARVRSTDVGAPPDLATRLSTSAAATARDVERGSGSYGRPHRRRRTSRPRPASAQ